MRRHSSAPSDKVSGFATCASMNVAPSSRMRRTTVTRATFEAFERHENIDSPKNMRPRHTP